MRKFMKNDGLNDYKAFQAAFSHTLEEIYCCTEHYSRAALSKATVFLEERTQQGMWIVQEEYFKDFSYSSDDILFIHQLCLILIPSIKN